MRPLPLSNVRVLDLGNFLAGPVVSLHLCAMGADVIKIEKIKGDDARTVGPFAGGESSYFMSLNRGKRSIAVDIKSAQGKAILKSLCAEADVLVENFRPGVMDKLGVGYDVLSKLNPRLIYCSISGFGVEGKHSQRPAFDSLLQAAGGMISATGPAEEGASPVRVGCSIIDMCSGLHSTIGILGAMHQRNVTGLGQRVDTSMLATTAMLMESPISRHSFGGDAYLPKPEGLAHPAVAPFDGFKTKDSMLYIATSNDTRAHIALKALNLEHLCSMPEYATNTGRMRNRVKLKAHIEDALKKKTTEEWEKELIPLGVPCSAINDIKTFKEKHPECFVEIDHPVAGNSIQAGAPFTMSFSGGSIDYSKRAPMLGEHTSTILSELGFCDGDIKKMRNDGVVV